VGGAGLVEGRGRRGGAYEDPDDGVMIGVVDVVGETFDDVEHVDDEFVFY